MTDSPLDSGTYDPPAVRAALHRKALADAGHRLAWARSAGTTEKDMLAIQHLAVAGELTPGQLSTKLHFTTGGITALLIRLQRAGHVTREPHPRDKRRALLHLTPAIEASATETCAPLVAELDAMIAKLPARDRQIITQFLEHAADAVERQADRLAADPDAEARLDADPAAPLPVPGLWA